MNAESYTTIALAAMGMAVSWAVWVSVSVFKHSEEIALLKQQVKILEEVKVVLGEIRDELHRNSEH